MKNIDNEKRRKTSNVRVFAPLTPVARPNSQTEMSGSPKLAGWKPVTRVTREPI